MIGNKCGDVGHIFIGHANSDLKLEQIAKYKFKIAPPKCKLIALIC